jgi:hypothetical protein
MTTSRALLMTESSQLLTVFGLQVARIFPAR